MDDAVPRMMPGALAGVVTVGEFSASKPAFSATSRPGV
jgi:hypothetical protein